MYANLVKFYSLKNERVRIIVRAGFRIGKRIPAVPKICEVQLSLHLIRFTTQPASLLYIYYNRQGNCSKSYYFINDVTQLPRLELRVSNQHYKDTHTANRIYNKSY